MSGSFRNLIRRIDALIAPPGAAPHPELTATHALATALEIKYRLILARSPDRYGVAHLAAADANRTLGALCDETLTSPEFLELLPFHLDRLRGASPQSLTWHLHLPRTAGSKLKVDWEAAGGVVVHLPPANATAGAPYWHAVAAALAGFERALAGRSRVLVSGHVALAGIDRQVRPGDRIVAAIREPIERALSLYRYAREMCSGGDAIVGLAGADVQAFYAADWRQRVAAHGLDPDRLTLRGFVEAGLCPDGQLALFLSLEPDIDDLAGFVRHAGIELADTTETLAGAPVNRTVRRGGHDEEAGTAGWLRAHYAQDLRHYAQLLPLVAPARRAPAAANDRPRAAAADPRRHLALGRGTP